MLAVQSAFVSWSVPGVHVVVANSHVLEPVCVQSVLLIFTLMADDAVQPVVETTTMPRVTGYGMKKFDVTRVLPFSATENVNVEYVTPAP